jgi:hypothetical protein
VRKLQTVNFRSFGIGERRLFKGDFHTVDKDGTEHTGPALGKNMWLDFATTHFQGTKDQKQFVIVETNEPSLSISFSMVVDGFFGYAELGYEDPRMRVILAPLGGSAWSLQSFDLLEAKDIQISHIPGTGTGSTGLLKHFTATPILSPTLNDLIDASIVPSFVLQKGADLDLIEAVKSGSCKSVPTDAVLNRNDSFDFLGTI